MTVVNPEALEHDGVDCFDEWTKILDQAEQSIPRNLKRADFSFIPGADTLYEVYIAKISELSEYTIQGSDIFDDFAERLLTVALEYMEAENDSAVDIDRVRAELDNLDP